MAYTAAQRLVNLGVPVQAAVEIASATGGDVTSVNGQTGAVVLEADDIGGVPADFTATDVAGALQELYDEVNP